MNEQNLSKERERVEIIEFHYGSIDFKTLEAIYYYIVSLKVLNEYFIKH